MQAVPNMGMALPEFGRWAPMGMAWLAGLIEGEGCIYRRGGSIGIYVGMTDRDVLQKALDVTGLGTITGPYQTGNPKHKPIFCWKVQSAPHAYAICASIYQFMGARRGAKILEVLEWYKRRNPILHLMHGTVTRYKRHKCHCDKCREAASRYRKQRTEIQSART